jgi:hypothetical protein
MAKHFDGETVGVDCKSIDSVLYDWCKVSLHKPRILGHGHKEVVDECKDEVGSEAG